MHVAVSALRLQVGTDAMLLGSWARPGPSCRRVLDVGTGTGVLALMVAQKLLLQQHEQHDGPSQQLGNEVLGDAEGSSSSNGGGDVATSVQPQGRAVAITAIDVCASAVQQARDNVAGTPWGAHIRVLHCSLQDLGAGRQEVALASGVGDVQQQLEKRQEEQQQHGEAQQQECGELHETSSRAVQLQQEEEHQYDMIITNPPYFVGSSKPADVSQACLLDMSNIDPNCHLGWTYDAACTSPLYATFGNAADDQETRVLQPLPTPGSRLPRLRPPRRRIAALSGASGGLRGVAGARRGPLGGAAAAGGGAVPGGG